MPWWEVTLIALGGVAAGAVASYIGLAIYLSRRP